MVMGDRGRLVIPAELVGELLTERRAEAAAGDAA
jgi:hypothetical protein